MAPSNFKGLEHMKQTKTAAPHYEEQPCAICGTTCSTHPDAANPIAGCGDCGRTTCLDHRVEDAATRCVDCAATFYATPTPTRTPAILIGEFVRIPAWRVDAGQVIDQRPALLGSDDAVAVLVEVRPDDPAPRWYRLEPAEFEVL
jgi:hypothetical protein